MGKMWSLTKINTWSSVIFKDSGNSSGRSATFRIIYYHKSHTFKDIDFKFFAVLGNIILDFFLEYGISHIFVENASICK